MVDKPQPLPDTPASMEAVDPPTWFGMKLRFGIREKFALLAFVLVLAVAFALPTLLFERTRKVVEDHELMDLQDEAELRCWEIIDWVNQARLQIEHCAKDPRELATLKTCLAEFPARGASAERGEQEWWRYVLALEVRPNGEATQTFHRTPGLAAPEPNRALLAAARYANGPHIGPILSLVTPAGYDSVKGAANSGSSPDRWQRIPAVWIACRIPSVPETVITMLVSLDRGRSARHLTFVMSGEGDFLQHPFARPDGKEEQIFSDFDLYAESDAITRGEKWGRGPVEAEAQVQRSDRPRFQTLQSPLYFLEGRLAPALHEKLIAAHDANRVELLDWTERLRSNMESGGVPFGGASRSSPGIRLLSRSKDVLEHARREAEAEYRYRFGDLRSNPVKWEAVVRLEHGDVQLTRFYLRHPQHDGATPGGRDFPYYFAYSAFREELASSIAHELQTLRRAGVWLAAGAGVLAFLIVLYFIGPLTRITHSAQTVTRSGSEALQLQNQIEAVRKSLPVRKHDEVGDIARSLETLLRQVLNGHEQLRQLNADLDTRVQEQTAELREANEQLRGLASAKDAFLASVSHELRQPLNSIFGFLQFLELSEPTDEQKHDLAKLRSAATYLRRLIDDILDYQKIIMGGVELDPEEIDAAAFLTSLQESMVPQATEKKNKLELRGAERLGTIFNDRARLQQVLTNLVSNACKFTQNGTVTLSASRDTDATGKDWITLDVADSGRGMKPEEMQGLFVRFKKLSAREGNKTGTGLGLVISKGLCELMGGTISCQSEFGQGSTFTVRVPAAVPERAGGTPRRTLERPTSSAAPAPQAVSVSPQQTVLVIDDDASVRELMTRYLGGKGFRVITAEDAEKGMVLAREQHPTVITLDVVLPGAQTGWDVLSQLKDDPLTASIPVIIVTFLEESRHGFALGAADYVVKPIAWEDLLGSLQKVIRGSASTQPVLVVDDDPDVRELFRRTLAMDGISIIEAANGAEALTQLRQQKPSLILLDLMMPVMDGFEFIAEFNLHPQWRDIPVIVITAKHVTREDRERLASSVRTVLEKSGFTQEDLLSKVLHLVHLAASEEGKRV
ncbi:response regulator [Roseimicrobium gellanilyticum]|nr:response regulator [Roseimicrobium gellanilyticum]